MKHLLLVLVFLLGDTSWGAHSDSISKMDSLDKASRRILAFASRKNFFNAQNCRAVLKDIYQAVYRIPPEQYKDIDKIKAPQKGKLGILERFFQARVVLRDRLYAFVKNREFKSHEELRSCSNMVQIAIRTLRNWEEYWSFHVMSRNGRLAEHPSVFDKKWPFTSLNKKYENEFNDFGFFRSGDVVLTRGARFSSAAISRIGAIDNQFSHLAMVYVDDGSIMNNPGGVYIVDSIFEAGLRIIPAEQFFSGKKSRLAIFRYRNIDSDGVTPAKETAKQAAKFLAQKAVGPTVCYNYSMDPDHPECMFCSQSVAISYQNACSKENIVCDDLPLYQQKGMPKIPLVHSSMEANKNFLIDILGIQSPYVFSPADVETEPHFDLVAEWRDYSLLEKARIMDMTLTKLFQWIERDGYHIGHERAGRLFSGIGVAGKEVVVALEELPPDTPEGFIEASVMIYFLMEHTGTGLNIDKLIDLPDQVESVVDRVNRHVSLGTHLTRANHANFERKGYFLTDYQMDVVLERLRQIDCKRFIEGQKTGFHDIFRPEFDGPIEEQCDPNPIYNYSELW